MNIGYIALTFSGKELELQVCRSAAGFYIGTMDPMLGPVSRESQEYYRTHEEAQYALDNDTFTQREYP